MIYLIVDTRERFLHKLIQDTFSVNGVHFETMQINTGMTALTATGVAVAIMHFESNVPFKIAQGNYVRMAISFNSTDTLVATSFEGIMPYFYFQVGSLAKTLCESGINLHLHPALDHAFPVFRDSSITNQLDFSGITKDGQDRAD